MLTSGLLGLLVGTILGLTGAGGGIFAVPALVFGLEMDIRSAAPVALLAVGSAAGFGAIQGLRQKIVRYRAASVLAVGGALTAPLGIKLAEWLPILALNYAFALIMLVMAYRMFISTRPHPEGRLSTVGSGICKVCEKSGRFIWNSRTFTTFAGIGMMAGLFTGMLGVGGGFIIVPALAYFSELKLQHIVATSLLVIALLAAITISFTIGHGLSFSAAVATFWSVTLVGMIAARQLAPKIPSIILQRVFSAMCVVVAITMLLGPVQ